MIGRLIDGRYQIVSRIARGGMATVYVANDLRLDRQVAMKIMHGHLSDENAFRERFVQEARSAARLAHPNVVSVFDQGQDSEMAYLVMEYLPGITLRDLLKETGRLTTEQTLHIMSAVLGGLAAAHQAGMVHRDVKPENVLLADDGRIKIGDFGLARATTAHTASSQALLGTIAYLSPELLRRGVADTRSDIYSSGIMMYEMLVGQQPFRGEQPMQIALQHANETVPPPSHAVSDIPVEIDELVSWATARDPNQRPHDAKVLLAQLSETQQEVTAAIQETTQVLRTAVLPRSLADHLNQKESLFSEQAAETQIFAAGNQTTNPALLAEETPSPLQRKTAKRRRRGFWLFAVVLVLAVVAGGTGWYFSFGPGAMTTVPTVANQTPTAATTVLTQLGLIVSVEQRTNPTVPAGSTIGTEPGAGSSVQNGAAVKLLVSAGPKMLDVPNFIGQIEATALQEITAAGFTAAGTQKEFSSTVAAGTVIQALGADGKALGAQYGEQQTITLIVSLGAVPDVVGKPQEEARAALTSVGLKPVDGTESYHDTVPAGAIISATFSSDPVRPGDTVSVNISRGPEPITVPDVIGLTWANAKAKLTSAGLVPQYNSVADTLPDAFKVSATDLSAGSTVLKGSKIVVSFNVF